MYASLFFHIKDRNSDGNQEYHCNDHCKQRISGFCIVNDPMMGMIVDNTHTKYGKFRIWLVIGTLINSVAFVFLFYSFHLQGTALYIYVSVMYILYGMTYTIMDVPYSKNKTPTKAGAIYNVSVKYTIKNTPTMLQIASLPIAPIPKNI